MKTLNSWMIRVGTLAALTVAAGVRAEEPIKIGIANLQRALTETKKGKTAKTTFEKESNAKGKELEGKKAELQKMQEELMKKSEVLNEKAKAEKQMQFQQKAAEFQQNVQMASMELEKRQAELMRPIIEGLRAIVPEISRKQKLDIVFEANSGAVLYAKSQTDITEELITAFDEKNKK
jgi:outer membrane protein